MKSQSNSQELDKPYIILDNAFVAGLNFKAPDWPAFKTLKPGMLKQLNDYYLQLALSCLPEKEKGYMPFPRGFNAAIDTIEQNMRAKFQ